MKKFFCCLFLCLFLAGDVRAEEKNVFLISPPFQEVVLEENDTSKKIEIEIVNKTGQQELFRISTVDFGNMDESGGWAFLGINEKDDEWQYGLASWMSLEKDSIILDPGTSKKLKVEIQNKENLKPGGHYGAVMVVMDSQPDNEGKKVGLNQSYASLIFVNKKGGEKYNLELSQSSKVSNWWKIHNEVELKFHNSGNVHVIPRGVVEIRDSANRLVKKGVINYESSYVLPESYRILNVELKNQKKIWWPGKYKMIIKYRFDGKTEATISENTFFYMTGPVLALIIISMFLILYKLRNRKDRF